jgi:hypothetical protein
MERTALRRASEGQYLAINGPKPQRAPRGGRRLQPRSCGDAHHHEGGGHACGHDHCHDLQCAAAVARRRWPSYGVLLASDDSSCCVSIELMADGGLSQLVSPPN